MKSSDRIRRRPLIEISRSSGFLPQVQALRAIAVGLVVLYHLWPAHLPGGYAGVDVFFVISGFLITANLLRESEQSGRISLPAFYARRMRRLLPAAAVVLIATSAMVYFLLPATRWPSIFGEVVGSGLYVENWLLLAQSTDYLAMGGAPSPVQHYWSLSVEEQFYLLWPLLIIAAILLSRRWKSRKRLSAFIVLGTVTVGSFAYNLILTNQDPAAAYFSTFTRAWEFGIGGMLALAGIHLARSTPLASIVSWLGLAMLACSGFVLNSGTPFPGTAALLPTAGTILVIVAGMPQQAWSPSKFMENRLVAFFGSTSYSLYLWHWPAIVMLLAVLGDDVPALVKGGMLALVVLLAWGTKTWIEDPIRGMSALSSRLPRVSLALGLASMLTVVIVAVAGISLFNLKVEQAQAQINDAPTAGERVTSDQLTPLPIVAAQDRVPDDDCWSKQDSPRVARCSYGDGGLRVALVGDSHAQALSETFIALAKERGWALDTYLKQACSWSAFGPMLKAGQDFKDNCVSWRADVQKDLESAKYDIIITTGAQYRVKPGNTADGLVAAWTPIVEGGTEIYVILDNPSWKHPPVECLIDKINPAECDESRTAAFPWADPQLAAAERVPGVKVIDLTDHYCGPEMCYSSTDGFTMYRDEDHFTATYARSLLKPLDIALAGIRDH